MRYKQGHKEQTYARIVAAAERSFKKNGYDGIGVDGLAKAAGVTSGAFYGHFRSKLDVFSASVTSGLNELKSAIRSFQQKFPDNWWSEFTKFYLGQKRTCDLTESCALQSLTAEVARSDKSIRKLFDKEIKDIVELASMQTSSSNSIQQREKTWANLAMLVGGVTLARATADKNLADEISQAVEKALNTLQN